MHIITCRVITVGLISSDDNKLGCRKWEIYAAQLTPLFTSMMQLCSSDRHAVLGQTAHVTTFIILQVDEVVTVFLYTLRPSYTAETYFY